MEPAWPYPGTAKYICLHVQTDWQGHTNTTGRTVTHASVLSKVKVNP